MPFCPKCGEEVAVEASWCPLCGANWRVGRDLLREEITETGHKEIIALMGVIMGLILEIVGLSLTAVKVAGTGWFFFIPYRIRTTWSTSLMRSLRTVYNPYASMATPLIVAGITVLLISGIVEIYYWYQRSKLMKQLESLK